jgi:hypothetical protein
VGIEVTLVDAASGTEFGRSVLPFEQLPNDFGAATKLSIGDQDWRVESAEPATPELARRSGRLRLVLRKATPARYVDPNQLGFSMSSICDQLPPDVPAREDVKGLVSVFEDFWRDIEFVGPGHDALIKANFKAIQRVYDEHRRPPGFAKVHVREEPRLPLEQARLSLRQLSAAFGDAEEMHAVTIDGYHGVIADGYALPVGQGLTIYGRAPAGVIEVAALDCAGDASFAAEAISALMADFGLTLVDWRSRLRIETPVVLRAWLRDIPQPLWR